MSGPAPEPRGYRSHAYAAALGTLGRQVPLGATGGLLLERAIPGTAWKDLMAPYPLFCCTNWEALELAVRRLDESYVTVTLVSDAFCPLPPSDLAEIFPICRPLHDHLVIDLTDPSPLSRHHRRKLRQTEGVQVMAAPAREVASADWVRLYETLIARKGIRDLRRFTPTSLRRQLEVPGAHLVTAWDGDEMVGADLYYLDRSVAYAHLSAYSEKGYAWSASYPMMAHAIRYFRDRARWIDLGGVPAVASGDTSGLLHFKSGWTDIRRPTFICGKVLNQEAYEALAPARTSGSAYFPAYRQGEFRS